MNLPKCEGCEHALRAHVRAESGEVVCLTSTSGVSTTGVAGIPWSVSCDCVNHYSKQGEEHRAYLARKEARYQEEVKRWQELLKDRSTKEEANAVS